MVFISIISILYSIYYILSITCYILFIIYYIKPHPIYNIPGGVPLSLSLALSLSLSLFIYTYMRAGQTSPHMEYGMRYDFYAPSEKRLPVDIIVWLIRRSLETIWRFEVTHIVPNCNNLD